jgi:hypothetical protein
MYKLTTAILKKNIESWVNQSPVFKGELLAHDIQRFGSNSWSRTFKRKIDASNVNHFGYLYEANGIAQDFQSDGMASLPTRPLNNLVGCIERGFLHKEADCFISIITDPTDQTVVAWTAQVD